MHGQKLRTKLPQFRGGQLRSNIQYDNSVYGYVFDGDEVARLDSDGIQALLALLDIRIFCNKINGKGTHISCIDEYG